MILIKVNGLEFLSKPGISVLEACKNLGMTIPRFCYHEILSVSGNCRMCLVEIENMEKPVASCVAEVEENMSIRVDSPFVKKARENVLEALLLNHPLDCPICDQAGECDLQDQAKTFGSSHSRFFFKKKTVEDKYCGPLIKTIMTRCITCTRCVRYAEEVAGVNYFGTLNRGVNTEIGSYIQKMFESEISGNVIDLCPVGALTSKPYAFRARPWELRLTESCDTTDSLGSNIYLNYKETEILRVLPKPNSGINNSLISDKARFSIDSNNLNRIKNVYCYDSLKNRYNLSSWKNLIKNIDNEYAFQNSKINVHLNQELELDSLVKLKELQNKAISSFLLNDLDCVSNNSNLYISSQQNIQNKMDMEEDMSVFLGCNLRLESALLNAKVRFKFRNSYLSNIGLGTVFDSNIPTHFLTLNVKQIISAFEGRSFLLSKILQSMTKVKIFIGDGFSNRTGTFDNVLRELKFRFNNFKFFNIYSSSNSDALKWLNIVRRNVSAESNSISFLINPRENFLTRTAVSKNKNLDFFLSSHGSSMALEFTKILPTSTSFESVQRYINLEHRPQKTSQSVKSVKEARNAGVIVSSLLNIETSVSQKSWFSHITEILDNPTKYTAENDEIINSVLIQDIFFRKSSKILKYPIKHIIKNYHLSSRMCCESKIMRNCSKEIFQRYTNFHTETHI